MSELSKITDPNTALEIAVGPAFPELRAQQPGTGLVIGGLYSNEPKRFIFKKAHMAQADFRIFDGDSGLVVAAMHHYGKNPYEKMEYLGVNTYNNPLGEWESICEISGYQGMPSLKIRPKKLSRHGRQLVSEAGSGKLLFNIGKESRLKEMALRSNLGVFAGESDKPTYRIRPDLAGRTFQILNDKEELVCMVQKSMKALIMNATLGAGSEMLIDVAPGVDWTAMVAVVMAIQQVGAHFVKDAVGNFVLDPAKSFLLHDGVQMMFDMMNGAGQ